ncbi:ankyrin repeat domain-containing protein, partial [Endozoicomonas sp. ONNA2]|uniref:ankyrin repeat domain-containing protein n=1 Tax=Endozoicomonas sp. ONNA2 TaxID=2828741 RepID=UPI0021476081
MQPTGMIIPISSNPQSTVDIDKTTKVLSEKHKPGTDTTKAASVGQPTVLRPSQNTVLSGSFFATRAVKLNPADAIVGDPDPGSSGKKPVLQLSDRLQLLKAQREELPISLKATSSCQLTQQANSPRQDLINLIEQGDAKKVKECITNNPLSLNIKDANGNSVLHLAILHGHEELCRVFVNSARHLLQTTNDNGEHPLHIAAREKQNKCLRFLLDNYPDTSSLDNALVAIDKSRMNPVQLAALNGNTAGLMAMLDYETGRHMLRWRGDSPVLLAIRNEHTECVAAILSRKKTEGVLFKYPYFRDAIAYGRLDCLKLLVQKYPDSFTTKSPFLKSLATLIQLAITSDHDKILQYLLEQPLFINHLTKMEYASEFICKKNSTCAKLIRDAREKVKLPFCPVKNFDKKLFQQTLQREKHEIAKKNILVAKQAARLHLHSLPGELANYFPGSISSTDDLLQVKALLSGLPEIGVYLRCYTDSADKKDQFWAMGDATASIEMIKTLVALGAKTIHAQLSPPDDSDFMTRQKYSHEEQVSYIKKQRIALSKLAYLLPGIKIKPGTQEIYLKNTRVIISTCPVRMENKINAAVTLSFIGAAAIYWQSGYVPESCLNVKPYRFRSEHESMYLDPDTSNMNNGNSPWSSPFNFLKSIVKSTIASMYGISPMPDYNITPLNLPVNSIIFSHDLQLQETEISAESVDSHQATLITAINQLCDSAAKGEIQTAVVYGLHHGDLGHAKTTILTNWLGAIKIHQDQVSEHLPVVVTTSVSAFSTEEGKSALNEIARTTGFTLIDFRDQQDRAALMAAGKGQRLLCLMPSLPRQSFNKLV